MKTTAIRRASQRSAVLCAAVGLAIIMVTVLAGAALLTACVSSGALDESAIAMCATALLAAATLLGGLVSMGMRAQGKWLPLVLCCAAELGIVLSAKLLAASGEPIAFGKTLLTVCASGAGAFGLAMLPKREGGKHRYPRRYR